MRILDCDAAEVCKLIDILRNLYEGGEVAIIADNADFGGPECVVSVRNLDCGEFRQSGESIVECLRKLVAFIHLASERFKEEGAS